MMLFFFEVFNHRYGGVYPFKEWIGLLSFGDTNLLHHTPSYQHIFK